MTHPDPNPCRWCGTPITSPRQGQKFCCDQHRYQWHKAQRISPGQLEERIRAIVREELERRLQGRGSEELATAPETPV